MDFGHHKTTICCEFDAPVARSGGVHDWCHERCGLWPHGGLLRPGVSVATSCGFFPDPKEAMAWIRGIRFFLITSITNWLVVWNIVFMTFHILGMSWSQLTNSYFSEGWLNHQPADLEYVIVDQDRTSVSEICDLRHLSDTLGSGN